MNRKTFTSEQIAKLSKNKHVNRCGSTSVMYKKSFRVSALKQYNEEGLTAVEIFESGGFDLSIIGIRKPNKLMHQWNKALRAKDGNVVVSQNLKIFENPEKKIRSGSKIRTLKAKVAYLQAENDFLALLRARRRG
jgi:hypothetical protein